MMDGKRSRKRAKKSGRTVDPRAERAHIKGDKYSIAYMLVAAGELSEGKIAEVLGVEVEALKEATRKRYFQQQVESIRNTEAALRAHGVPFTASGRLAMQALEALQWCVPKT